MKRAKACPDRGFELLKRLLVQDTQRGWSRRWCDVGQTDPLQNVPLVRTPEITHPWLPNKPIRLHREIGALPEAYDYPSVFPGLSQKKGPKNGSLPVRFPSKPTKQWVFCSKKSYTPRKPSLPKKRSDHRPGEWHEAQDRHQQRGSEEGGRGRARVAVRGLRRNGAPSLHIACCITPLQTGLGVEITESPRRNVFLRFWGSGLVGSGAEFLCSPCGHAAVRISWEQ